VTREEVEAIRAAEIDPRRPGWIYWKAPVVGLCDALLAEMDRAEVAERRLERAWKAWRNYCLFRDKTNALALDAALKEEPTHA